MIERAKRAVPRVLIALPLAVQALVVQRFGVNSLVWDEFFYVPFVKRVIDKASWVDWLGMQHNEHRLIPTKILLAIIAPATHWNNKTLMYASVVLAGGVVSGFWQLYKLAGGRSAWRFVPAAWLLCGLAGFESMLYGLETSFYFTAVGVVWSLVGMSRGGWAWFAVAMPFAVLASSSTLNGLLIWPIGLVVAVARGEHVRVKAGWCVAGTAVCMLYFAVFTWPNGVSPGFPRHFQDFVGATASAIASIGTPLGANSVLWSTMMGGILVAASAAVLRHLWRNTPTTRSATVALGGAMLFGLGSIVMITMGRYTMTSPLQSRYVIFSCFTAAGLYIVMSVEREAGRISEPLMARSSALLVAALIVTNSQGLQAARQWRRTRLQEQYLLQTIDQQSDDAIGGLYFRDQIRGYADVLRRAGLGPYAEPHRLFLLVNWKPGTLADAVSDNAIIEQRFTCQVDTLWDASVPIAVLNPGAHTTLEVSIWRKDQRLGVHSTTIDRLTDGTAVTVRLDTPLSQCLHQELALRIRSDSASSGDASIWTYPTYIDGELTQGGHLIAQRSAGLSLNALHFDILR